MRLHGLLLDFDGTLADSLPVMRQAYHCFLDAHGRIGSDAEFDSLNGPPLAEVVHRLKRAHGLDDPAEVLLTHYWSTIDSLYASVPPRAGARELLDWARRQGMATAVVSSNDTHRIHAWLARTGLAGLIDVVVGGDRFGRGKPDPEPYRLALEQLRCPPAAAVAVEDSPQGAQAALAASLCCFGLVGQDPIPDNWPDGVRPIAGLPDILHQLQEWSQTEGEYAGH